MYVMFVIYIYIYIYAARREDERTSSASVIASVRSISYINIYAARREDVLFLTFKSRRPVILIYI